MCFFLFVIPPTELCLELLLRPQVLLIPGAPAPTPHSPSPFLFLFIGEEA